MLWAKMQSLSKWIWHVWEITIYSLLMAQQNFQLTRVVCTKSNYYFGMGFYDILMCLACFESILITIKWKLDIYMFAFCFSEWLKLIEWASNLE